MRAKTQQLEQILANDGSGCECFSERALNVARAELSQLRAKAAEYDRIAELIDPNDAQNISIYEQIVNLLHDDTTREYAPAQQDTTHHAD